MPDPEHSKQNAPARKNKPSPKKFKKKAKIKGFLCKLMSLTLLPLYNTSNEIFNINFAADSDSEGEAEKEPNGRIYHSHTYFIKS